MFELVRLLTGRAAAELAGVRADLESWRPRPSCRSTRQLGFVALIAADGSIDKAWDLGTSSRSTSLAGPARRRCRSIRDPASGPASIPRSSRC